ncbi:DUF1853 family protein [Reinekea blandensis]|uniref:DUF1853 family protein n=1 Tax=Reinekea blandensis MED297 TaxID=314283 RepID=A4BC41_9GAMM|nr:DUF1853 family protein [Reinekea blandensis]EAR10526.1 hypothetical protein MED297_01855 [Reinekea sp. MED297] [Reinekea blandensis MED297]
MNEHLLYRAFTDDLEWILNTPSLLQDDIRLFRPDTLSSIDLHNIRPDAESLQRARRQKLGYYFEFLVRTLFEAHPDYDILAENQIIQSQSRTLGELDLLLRHRPDDRVIHLELALKFYLQVPSPGDLSTHWVGAGLKDFFHAKLHRLYHHQLRLPEKARVRNCWPEALPFPDESLLWLPGRLYVPAQADKYAQPVTHFMDTPWLLNEKAHCSYWLEAEQGIPPQAQALGKADWLNGRPLNDHSKPLPAQFSHPSYASPIYVVPFHWYSNALHAIHNYQQTL